MPKRAEMNPRRFSERGESMRRAGFELSIDHRDYAGLEMQHRGPGPPSTASSALCRGLESRLESTSPSTLRFPQAESCLMSTFRDTHLGTSLEVFL